MFDSDDLQASQLKYQEIPIPNNLDEYIQKGIAKGKRQKRKSFTRNLSLIAACFLLVALVTSIRVSPAVAAYMSKIPGLEHIVKLINYDKGLTSAVENDFFQPIDAFSEHDGLLFKVDGIIADESSIVVFYTIENKGNYQNLRFGKIEFLDEKGEHVRGGYSWGSYPQDMRENPVYQNKIIIHFSEKETVIPDQLTVRVQISDEPVVEEKPIQAGSPEDLARDKSKFPEDAPFWEVTFPIDKTKFANQKQTYTLNQELKVAGQKIMFKEMTIYPTRISLDVEYDPMNTARIFTFEDLKFVDEKGEEWARISNGVTGSKPSENEDILYFQSNYFSSPKELYLAGSTVRLLPKEECRVLVNLDQKEILEAPAGLELKDVVKGSGKITANFTLKVGPKDKNYSFNLFPFTYKDATGKEYHMVSQGSSSPLKGKEELMAILPDEPYVYPLQFGINDYPNRVTQEFRFQVK